jgi:uncharacterized protein
LRGRILIMSDKQDRQIVDIHSHIFWYPDHLSLELVSEALAAKKVKIETSGGLAHAESLDLYSNDALPDEHYKMLRTASKIIVFGIQAEQTGFNTPNEVIAEYVKRDPVRLEGWASVNPTREDALEKFRYAIDVLGLRGLKVGPTYQHFDPSDSKYWTLFTECEQRDLPVMIHMGTTYPSKAKIALAQPLLLEPLIMAHPNLRMIIAHLGHPWESDTIALIRKSPNIFSDISALHFRPWRFYQALITAVEYGVTHKLLLGSDFANSTIDDAIKGLRNVNSILEGTKLPRIPEYVIDNIIYENWKRFFHGNPN